jgi:hypothetical protein
MVWEEERIYFAGVAVIVVAEKGAREGTTKKKGLKKKLSVP